MSAKLAINGGPPAVPPGLTFTKWPQTDEADEKLVLEAIRQDNHTGGGPHAVQLREEFAAWNGNEFCIPTNCGSAALHMCVAGCNVGAGDEVITTALSWTSSATCIIHHSAVPVFVDADWETMHIDPAKIEAAITDRTAAILVVHYWGVACDMDAIMAIADRHDLPVIEDACQSPGSLYKGRKVGTIGSCAGFSTNQNKNFCSGEGGFFVTNDAAVHERARAVMSFSDMRPADAGRDYHQYGLGYKYGTANLVAAFALSQLRKLDHTNAWAQENWRAVDDMLVGTPNLVRMYSSDDRPTNGYAYVPRVDPAYAKARGVSLQRMTARIAEALKAEGTPFSQARWLLPAHGVFQAKNAFGKGAPWTHHARPDISYDVDQFPVAQDCVDTCMWNINLHRPPNGIEQAKAVGASLRKVFENLDELEV